MNTRLKAEEQISFVKDVFRKELKKSLELTKVSSPIAIIKGEGINDELNGIERCVEFPVKQLDDKVAVIVNSLAKWKRIRLKELEITPNTGILTDMRAIRPDEDYSAIHSIYVDQWDWEKSMPSDSRNIKYLKQEVEKVYTAILETEKQLSFHDTDFSSILPKKITFIHSEELLQKYPNLSPKERENKITKEFGAVFIIGIGGKLSNGFSHDGRAADYDDWSTINEDGYKGLNGDILLWNPVTKSAFEVSSMGIRVNKETLLEQLKERGESKKMELKFHQMLLNDELPQSIGGGIGQSRICMYFLRKKHIGEVQVGVWCSNEREKLKQQGIELL